SQSSNDVFPSSIHIAATQAAMTELLPALEKLAGSLQRKSEEVADVVKAGRTHLMDATPVTLGQEFGGYAQQIRSGIDRVAATLPRLADLLLGGTATGPGIHPPAGFPQRVTPLIAERADRPRTEAPNRFACAGAHDSLVEAAGQLRTSAVSLVKLFKDLRWM